MNISRFKFPIRQTWAFHGTIKTQFQVGAVISAAADAPVHITTQWLPIWVPLMAPDCNTIYETSFIAHVLFTCSEKMIAYEPNVVSTRVYMNENAKHSCVAPWILTMSQYSFDK